MLLFGKWEIRGRETTVVADRGRIELAIRSLLGTATMPGQFARTSFTPRDARKLARQLVDAADATEGRIGVSRRAV